jgi:hypothetical protein
MKTQITLFLLALSLSVAAQSVVTVPEPVYLNTFEVASTAQIVGEGSYNPVTDPGFGTVFQNATGGMRQNYLLLPEDALSHSSASNEITIGVWVNAVNAGASNTYMWSPLFAAYGAAPVNNANTWPMLALQYRGVVQVNCAGWCDFTDAQNVKGANILYHDATDWLVDHQWHYYTATFTETTAKVFFDGVAVNEWAVDGTTDGSVIKGLFSNGADLKYICLGGNQAWDWGDPDPGFMFDDIAIYDKELTAEQIACIIAQKNAANGIKAPLAKTMRVQYDRQAQCISIQGLPGNEKVELYNLYGQRISTATGQATISTAHFNKGCYLVKAADYTQKILVN